MLLVAAARPGEAGALESTIRELGSYATMLRPAALSARGVGALVRRRRRH